MTKTIGQTKTWLKKKLKEGPFAEDKIFMAAELLDIPSRTLLCAKDELKNIHAYKNDLTWYWVRVRDT